MANTFPTIAPSQSSKRVTKRNTVTASFGNTYEQRMLLGINAVRDYWDLSWENLNSTDKDTVMAFIASARDGSTFTWTNPFDNISKKFVLDPAVDDGMSNNGGLSFTITCAIKQVFDLT